MDDQDVDAGALGIVRVLVAKGGWSERRTEPDEVYARVEELWQELGYADELVAFGDDELVGFHVFAGEREHRAPSALQVFQGIRRRATAKRRR